MYEKEKNNKSNCRYNKHHCMEHIHLLLQSTVKILNGKRHTYSNIHFLHVHRNL